MLHRPRVLCLVLAGRRSGVRLQFISDMFLFANSSK